MTAKKANRVKREFHRHETFDSMWSRHEQLVWSIATRLAKSRRHTISEVMGPLTILFNRTLHYWKEDKGAFSTFFYRVVYSNIYEFHYRDEPGEYYRYAPKNKKRTKFIRHKTGQEGLLFIADEEASCHEWRMSEADHSLTRYLDLFDTVEDFWEFVRAQVGEVNYQLFLRIYKKGDSLRECAEGLGITKGHLSKKMSEIRRSLREAIEKRDAS